MENKLVVNCDICDARKANEEILKKFEQICINADCLLVDERSKAVISQLPVKCNLSRVIQIESEEEVGTVSYNGKYEITGELPCTGKKLLCVNGLLVIHPGTEEILKSYIQIFVNGAVSYPESMSAWISQISVNGSMESYPDHYTLMEREWILDRYFPIRAKENGNYFSAKSIEITDKAVDTSGIQFYSRKHDIKKRSSFTIWKSALYKRRSYSRRKKQKRFFTDRRITSDRNTVSSRRAKKGIRSQKSFPLHESVRRGKKFSVKR